MKTKIIYISGNELFEMADIRTAFDEVRKTLGLTPDTVLFGVPVDADDAGLQPGVETAEKIPEVIENQIVEDIVPEPVAESKPKLKKAPAIRAKKPEPAPELVTKEEFVQEPVIEPEPVKEKVIPILSILSGKSDDVIDDVVPDVVSEPVFIEPVSTTVVVERTVEKVIIQEQVIDDFDEFVTDEMPESDEEKTLEKLFERIAPLREDYNVEKAVVREQQQPEEVVTVQGGDEEDSDILDEDATLEQLATEFVEKQDDIAPVRNADGAGKIGKLKNILPFKKAKREEPGLMGDLFGWAGIAANDDEFSIPGFFTTAASKN